jgi:hypothetical protein
VIVRQTDLNVNFNEAFLSCRTAGNQGWTWSQGFAYGIPPNRGMRLSMTHQGVAQYTSSVNITGVDNEYASFGFTDVVSSTVRLFAKGAFIDSLAVGAMTSPGSQAVDVGGAGPGASSQYFNGNLVLALLWDNRALTDAEHAELARNPWQLFEPQPYQFFKIPTKQWLSLPRVRTRQPQTYPRLNPRFSAGLTLAFLGTERRPVNRVTGRFGDLRSVESEYSNGVGPLGKTINTYTGSGRGVQFPVRSEKVSSCTLIIGISVTDVWNVFVGFEADNNTYIGGNGSGQFNIRQGGTDLVGGTVAANTFNIIAVSFNGTAVRAYKNGAFQLSGTGGSTAFSSMWNFGGNAGGGGSSNPKIAFAYVWDRPLSDAELISLSLNPWQLFLDDTARLQIAAEGGAPPPPPPAGGTEYTVSVSDGIYMLDPDSRDRHSNITERLLLAALRSIDYSKLVPRDAFMFADNRTREQVKQITEGLLVADVRYFDLLLARIDMLMLGDSSLQQLLGAGGLYERSALDGLVMNDARYFDVLIGRLSMLLLYDTGATQVTVPGQVLNEVAASDGLLLDDRRLSNLALAIVSRMLLADTPYVGAEKAREALDKLLLVAMPRALSIELNRTDVALLNDYITQARSLLWAENLVFTESQATALIGTLVAYLVYARLRGTEFLGIRLAFQDYLGRRIGSTKWRLDL